MSWITLIPNTIGSLYKAFPPEEAKRYRDILEIHYTPKHGSWLNMAEIEINILTNHGLSQRVPTLEQMKKEVKAWAKTRNKAGKKSTGDFLLMMPALNLNTFIHYLNSAMTLASFCPFASFYCSCFPLLCFTFLGSSVKSSLVSS